MARGAREIMPRWPGALALGLVMALVLGAFGAVLARAGAFAAVTSADWAAARFTVMQAGLSALLSAGLAVPVARALARRRFPGRQLVIVALGAPFILPVIVAVMGLLAIFGRAGWLNAGLALLGLPKISLYGLDGILLAHVFLNLPFAVRLLLNGWASIPAERFRLAAALGFGPREVWHHIERPMLRAVLPGVTLAIFLVCLTSFTVILVMGGGPRATTLELAIYQAFRLEFDLGHAAALASLQMALSLAAAGLGLAVARPAAFGAGLGRVADRWDRTGRGLQIFDAALLVTTGLFIAAPMLAVLASGLPWIAGLPGPVWTAAGRTVIIALVAALVAVSLALATGLLITTLPTRTARVTDAAVMLAMTASPLVIGTGLFLILRKFTDPIALALPVVTLVNAGMAMPFCLRVLLPGLAALRADYDRLSASLGLTGATWVRLVALPRLRRPLAFASGLAAALSAGDLGVVALFADPGRATLPMQVYALAGAYRTDQAAGAAIVLVLIAFGLFRLFDRLGDRDADL